MVGADTWQLHRGAPTIVLMLLRWPGLRRAHLTYLHLRRTHSAQVADADAHWYVCMQKPFKLHPRFDVMLAGVLAGDPKARLPRILTLSLLTTPAGAQWRLAWYSLLSHMPDCH